MPEWDEFLERMAEGQGGQRWEAYRSAQIERTRARVEKLNSDFDWALRSRGLPEKAEGEGEEARRERLLADFFSHPAWDFAAAAVPLGALTMRDLVDVALGYDAQHITARRAAAE